MKLESIEDLSKLIDMCRKKGIETIKVDGESVEFKLKEAWAPKKRIRKDSTPELQDLMSPEEQALFWSSTPHIPGE